MLGRLPFPAAGAPRLYVRHSHSVKEVVEADGFSAEEGGEFPPCDLGLGWFLLLFASLRIRRQPRAHNSACTCHNVTRNGSRTCP
jgi:hypothetical protein